MTGLFLPPMRKKARPRNPEEPVVATFMIAYDKWHEFKTVVEAEGSTISAALVSFVEGYLTAVRSPNLSTQEINLRLQHILRHHTAHWEQQVLTLQHRVLKTEAGLENLDFVVDNLQRERAARPVELDIAPLDLDEIHPDHEDPPNTEPDGLTQATLCRAFGIKPHNLTRNANLRGMTLEAYLYELTGWSYRHGRYYPP